jgi:hypothetical protein
MSALEAKTVSRIEGRTWRNYFWTRRASRERLRFSCRLRRIPKFPTPYAMCSNLFVRLDSDVNRIPISSTNLAPKR